MSADKSGAPNGDETADATAVGIVVAGDKPDAPEMPPRKRLGFSPSMIPFAVVSACYLLYTTTDGAIRMIVLLHAYQVRHLT